MIPFQVNQPREEILSEFRVSDRNSALKLRILDTKFLLRERTLGRNAYSERGFSVGNPCQVDVSRKDFLLKSYRILSGTSLLK